MYLFSFGGRRVLCARGDSIYDIARKGKTALEAAPPLVKVGLERYPRMSCEFRSEGKFFHSYDRDTKYNFPDQPGGLICFDEN